MAELKTKQHDADVFQFIKTFANSEQKREDSFELVKLMQKVTGHPPKMWGPSMIGFGSYHYKSDRSKQEGDWPLVAFSPRKAASHYMCFRESDTIFAERLGKYSIKRLASMLRDCRHRLTSACESNVCYD